MTQAHAEEQQVHSDAMQPDLQQEEEHGLDLVLGPCDYEHAPVAPQGVSAGDDCLDGFWHAILHVDEVVLGTDQHSPGTILTAWDRNQKIGSVIHRLRGLADDMIQSQVKLIQHQLLLCF